jgi:putative oxidoreductase
VAPLAFIVAVAIEVGGGLMLLSGYRVRLASLVMAVFSLATAFFFHRNFGDQNQMIHFLKNVMIAGGLFQITYFGAGAWSLDARTANSPPVRRPWVRTETAILRDDYLPKGGSQCPTVFRSY